MADNILQLDSIRKKYSLSPKDISKSIMEMDNNVSGYNEDLTDKYFWHLNFPYYTGKGYTPLKLEDYHYFSENSQFGTQMRQIKGGSIRAFQENFQQLIQLIRVHLLPLLKEVKTAHMYKDWFDKITVSDEKIQELKLKGIKDDSVEIRKLRGDRNEAINHLKDKWVNEVDMGRLWQLNRSASEQGLDFALLPHLFFGTSLDDPLQKKKGLKEQLDEDIYSIDISYQAKEQVARFMYRFYTWLPSAISDTTTTFKLKVSALKNIYAQVQMHINFMKPLLIEISRKSEGFESSSLYKDFEMDNPEFVSLFDYSYSYVKVLGVRNFQPSQRGTNTIHDLEFTRYGLFIPSSEIRFGNFKGKTGFLAGISNNKYIFYPSKDKDLTDEEFRRIKDKWDTNKIYLKKDDLRIFPIIELNFAQKRRTEILQTPQGAQQVPFMRNKIEYKAYSWNIYEVASYRENLKVDNLKLLETFIEELAVMKEDLLLYVNYFSDGNLESLSKSGSDNSTNNSNSSKKDIDTTLIFGPFKALGDMVSPLIPNFSFNFSFNFSSKNKEIDSDKSAKQNHRRHIKLSAAEDAWKCYTIFKKSSQLIQY